MDAMLALEPARASAQAPPQSADDEPEEEEQDVPLLKRQLLGIIRDAQMHIAFGGVRLQPPETRRHLLDRVHQLQAQYEEAMHHRMPIMLHACASLLYRGLSAPFLQSNLMALLRAARRLVRRYELDFPTSADDIDIRDCLGDLVTWTCYERFRPSDVELRQMLCVVVDICRDMLDGVSPLLRNRYMPVVDLLEAAHRHYHGIDVRDGIDRAGRLMEDIKEQLDAEQRAEHKRRLAELKSRELHAHPTTHQPMF
jgi:hypothetical protein